MKKHELLCWPEYFRPTMRLEKTFEVRLDDRGYEVEDELWLREWNPFTKEYTGFELVCAVPHILRKAPGLADGYIIMSIFVMETINLNAVKRQGIEEGGTCPACGENLPLEHFRQGDHGDHPDRDGEEDKP